MKNKLTNSILLLSLLITGCQDDVVITDTSDTSITLTQPITSATSNTISTSLESSASTGMSNTSTTSTTDVTTTESSVEECSLVDNSQICKSTHVCISNTTIPKCTPLCLTECMFEKTCTKWEGISNPPISPRFGVCL